jgi:hypothetical protein
MLLSARSSRRGPSRSQEIQRVVFYLSGGVVSLLFMLLLARQMNPSDDRLVNAPLVMVMAHWEGQWEGRETVYTLGGARIADYEALREYHSSTPNFQTVSVTRRFEDRIVNEQVWLNQVDQDGRVQSRRGGLDHLPAVLFSGSVDAGTILWSREDEECQELVRTWTTENALHVEEIYISKIAPGESRLTTGRYTRVRPQ